MSEIIEKKLKGSNFKCNSITHKKSYDNSIFWKVLYHISEADKIVAKNSQSNEN